MNNQAKNAVLSAFRADSLEQDARQAAGTMAEFLLELAREQSSMEQFSARVQEIETWAKSPAGRKAIENGGYTVNESKKGKFLMPRAWVQAVSDLRATFKYGVDLKATTKDKDGNVVPMVPTMSVARKLKAEAREAALTATNADDGSGEATEYQIAKRELRSLAKLLDTLTEGQAAAMANGLRHLREQLTAAPKQAEKATKQAAA